ncbi:MAG: sensor histidine kinase [Terrimonas sp.]|nr:sensor histidine kinase [Terrimonas sp.]
MYKDPEIYFVVTIGVVLGLLLVGFIVTILFLYQRSRHRQEKEMVKSRYDQEMLRSQLEIQEQTFKNISQELHDNIGQMLSVVKLTLAALSIEKDSPSYSLAQNAQEVLNKAIADLSNLTKSLHTDRITEVGLTDSIKYELAAIKNAGLMGVNFSVKGNEFQFTEQKAIFLFRIFQEFLHNTLKHAGASEISVSLVYGDDDTFVLNMRDNGVGFDLSAKKLSGSSSKGVGLKNLFNRAELIGADMQMESTPGLGTSIVIQLPPQL